MNAPLPSIPGIHRSWTRRFGLSALLLVALVGCADTEQPAANDISAQSPVSIESTRPSVQGGWLQSIPDAVHIDTNLHAGRNGAISEQSRRVHRASLLGISCSNPPDLDVGTVDRVGVDAPDYPGDSRTLYLYADAYHAKQRFTLTQHWLSGCNGTTECCTTRLHASSIGDASFLEVTTDVGTGAGPTARWLRLIRVGNALLLTDSNDGSSPGPALQRGIRRQLHDIAPVLRELEVFAAPSRSTPSSRG